MPGRRTLRKRAAEKLGEIGKWANGTESGFLFFLGGGGTIGRSPWARKRTRTSLAKVGVDGSSASGSEDGADEGDDSSAVSMRSGTLGAVGFLIFPILTTFLR